MPSRTATPVNANTSAVFEAEALTFDEALEVFELSEDELIATTKTQHIHFLYDYPNDRFWLSPECVAQLRRCLNDRK